MKIPIIISIAIGLLIYLFVGIPFLSSLVEVNGILLIYPMYIALYAVFAYLAGSMVGHGGRVLVLFIIGFLILEILHFPIIVPMENPPVHITPSEMLAGDYFFYEVYTTLGLSHFIAWFATYFVTPITLIFLLLRELRARSFSKIMPKLF